MVDRKMQLLNLIGLRGRGDDGKVGIFFPAATVLAGKENAGNPHCLRKLQRISDILCISGSTYAEKQVFLLSITQKTLCVE